MPTKNGRTKRVLAWVAANPGRSSKDIGEACDFDHHNGLLSYMVKAGKLHRAGATKRGRFYIDAATAQANHQRHCEDAARHDEAKKIEWAATSKARRKLRQDAEKIGRASTRIGIVRAMVGPGVKINRKVKITIAKPMPESRWAPDPGFERVITSDWMLRRQGDEQRECRCRA